MWPPAQRRRPGPGEWLRGPRWPLRNLQGADRDVRSLGRAGGGSMLGGRHRLAGIVAGCAGGGWAGCAVGIDRHRERRDALSGFGRKVALATPRQEWISAGYIEWPRASRSVIMPALSRPFNERSSVSEPPRRPVWTHAR